MKKKASKKTVAKRPYVIVRCTGAGVHSGELVSKTDHTVVLANSRRLWRWYGCETLSELALRGAKDVANTRFAPVLPTIELSGWHEIIPCAAGAIAMIKAQPEWVAK
jgi:hypothetical protein